LGFLFLVLHSRPIA